jgi:hypothetical protein
MQVAGCRADVLGGDSASWAGRMVEDFAFVVIPLPADNSGMVLSCRYANLTTLATRIVSR